MRKLILFLTIFLLIPSVFAGIAVTIDKSEFNLGDKLKANVEIIEENDLDGFFRLSVICGNKTFEYYATPVSLRANVNKKIDVEPMVLFEDLLGECYLEGVLKSPKDYTVDQGNSALFTVSDALNIFLVKSSFTVDPGESINIEGSVKKIYDVNIGKADITLVLDDKTTTFAIKGIIDYNLEVPSDIKSGTHFMDIIAQDSYGNKGKEIIELNVNPIPTIIITELNKDLFLPSETLEVGIKLLDQANDLMEGIINFEIINPENGKIHMQTVDSDSVVKYTFEQDAIPGEYKLKSFLNDLLKEDFIVMQEYEKLKVSLEGNLLYVENIGNVKYNKKNTIILEDDKNNEYIIRKKINLKPGEFTTIDLSKEVPEGNYKVELPEETVENVPIEDNRNFVKKVGQGIGKITGNIVGAEQAMKVSNFAFYFIIVVIITMVVITNRKKIKKLIRKV